MDLSDRVWLLKGISASEEGTLRFAHGRVSFRSVAGERLFDVAVAELQEVAFPWYYFGGGMKLTTVAGVHRISFMRPGNRGGRLWHIGRGLQLAKQWKAALASKLS